MEREHIVLTRLPEGFTRDELHAQVVDFTIDDGPETHLGTGILLVRPKPDGFFEIEVRIEVIDHSSQIGKQTILHQTSLILFLIERQLNPGGAAFRLSSYNPSQSDPQDTRGALFLRSCQTDEE